MLPEFDKRVMMLLWLVSSVLLAGGLWFEDSFVFLLGTFSIIVVGVLESCHYYKERFS